MKKAGARKQALFLTAVNAAVRALGLVMRIWLSRVMGAEAMGVMELSQSVHMAAIAPLTSGLPVAVSRLTAQARPEERPGILGGGLAIVRRMSLLLIPALWLLSPMISRLMGDVRMLPSLWFTAPCILVLGYSAVYNGYSYGLEKSHIPAVSELIEQAVRLMLVLLLIKRLSGLTIPWLAAVPAAGTLFAEIIGLVYVLYLFRSHKPSAQPSVRQLKAIWSLAAPGTLNRISQTLLRTLTTAIIPLRLHQGGLSAAEATAQLGMLNGMVGPFLMLPGIFTSAVCMVAVPKIAKAEKQPSELRRLLTLCMLAVLPPAVLCALAVYAAAPFLAAQVFHEAALSALFRKSAFQLALMPLGHMLASTLSALGKQKESLGVSLITSAFSAGCTWLMAGSISGVICAQYAGLVLAVLLNACVLLRFQRRQTL